MSIRQWDTDWFDQWKKIFATDLSSMIIRDTDALWWCPIRDIPFGQKQSQSNIRVPDQRIHKSKDVEYPYEKYADRQTATRDLPSLTQALRIDEELYANDPVNALGHVSDLNRVWKDGLAYDAIIGSTIPLAYGLIDAGAGTGSTTTARPDMCDDVTTNGAWDVTTNITKDFADMAEELESKGFTGRKVICTHPLLRGRMNLPITNTATNAFGYNQMAFGYAWDFSVWYDENATKNAIDVYMVDADAHEIHHTPHIMRSFWSNETESFVWRWKTRAYMVSNPINDDTDWNKGIVKCTVDMVT
jgi:hypothetical protein